MGLFDIFTFKNDASKVFTEENFTHVLNATKDAIVREVKSNIEGTKKKAVVDAIVLAKVDYITANVTNKWVLWIIDKIKDVIPTVTQLVYDFLKEKIENL